MKKGRIVTRYRSLRAKRHVATGLVVPERNKVAAFAPMPRARVRTATAVKPGRLAQRADAKAKVPSARLEERFLTPHFVRNFEVASLRIHRSKRILAARPLRAAR